MEQSQIQRFFRDFKYYFPAPPHTGVISATASGCSRTQGDQSKASLLPMRLIIKCRNQEALLPCMGRFKALYLYLPVLQKILHTHVEQVETKCT